MSPSWLLAGIVATAAAAAGPEAIEVGVYAAASLRDVLIEIIPRCEEREGVRVVLNTAASSDLAQQIRAAGKADLFISADEEWMDRLASEGLVDAPSRRPLVSNRLVVIVSDRWAPAIERPIDLAGPAVRRLSIADPRGVPAGRYTRAWLERIGLWEKVRERVVPALDVRAALAVVESGAADAGIVYATDAATSRRVRVVYPVPAGEGPDISYPVASMTGRPHLTLSRALVECLASRASLDVFERHGFVVPRRERAIRHGSGGP